MTVGDYRIMTFYYGFAKKYREIKYDEFFGFLNRE